MNQPKITDLKDDELLSQNDTLASQVAHQAAIIAELQKQLKKEENP